MSIKKIDNYRIRLNQILGVNGNAFIGYNNITKQEVVIKVLNKSEIAKKYHKNFEAFKQQVKFLHKIRKSASYVVRYLNMLQTHNHFYIVQQFCKGGNLKKILSQKKLSTSEAFKYMRHILKGFLQLIKKGIHHGNLTPSNILFHNGLMKLTDFGLQLNKIAQSLDSQIKNTVYVAPQVLIGKNYTQKSDIWSLGFIFYQMIYGIVPWKTGGSVKTYIQRLQNQPLQFPSQPQISPQLKNLITGCLQLDPSKRIQWTDIYLNDVFNGEFLQIQSIDIKLGYILGGIRNSLNHSNLDLQRYFQDHMVSNQSILDFESFQQILLFMDQSLEIDDIRYLFNVFDSNRTKMIEFSSLKNSMEHYDISIQFQPLRKKQKKKTQFYENRQQMQQDILEKALQKLVRQMKEKRINDIDNIFGQSEKDLSRLMNFLQFSNLLRKIDPRLTEDQCIAVHKKIDVRGSGKISYQQFIQSICVFTGLPYKYRPMIFTNRKSF